MKRRGFLARIAGVLLAPFLPTVPVCPTAEGRQAPAVYGDTVPPLPPAGFRVYYGTPTTDESDSVTIEWRKVPEGFEEAFECSKRWIERRENSDENPQQKGGAPCRAAENVEVGNDPGSNSGHHGPLDRGGLS